MLKRLFSSSYIGMMGKEEWYVCQVDVINYGLLPVNSITGMIFLLLILLILNSLFFKLTNVGVSIMTTLAFVVWF